MHQIYFGEMFLHLQLEPSRLGIFSVPTDKKKTPTEGSQGVNGRYFENCLRLYIDKDNFPSFGSGKSLLKFVQLFYMRPVYYFCHTENLITSH